jgi:hypothetical protein
MPNLNHSLFSFPRFAELFGVPYRDPRVQDIFLRAGLLPDNVLRELRTGIYSMPPHDRAPCPVTEIDLSPSYRLRVRFKEAHLVARPTDLPAVPPNTPVFSGLMYLLEAGDDVEPFFGELPFGIQPSDDLKGVVARVGAPPTQEVFRPSEESGYALWEDRSPRLHVLFSIPAPQAPLRVNVFLPPATNGPQAVSTQQSTRGPN